MNFVTNQLFIIFLILPYLHASEDGPYAGGISFGPVSKQKTINPKDYPNINITLEENNKTLSCNLDSAVDVYICANGNNPYLVKYSVFGFITLGRDVKGNSAKNFTITSVETNSKKLFEQTPFLSGVYDQGSAVITTDFNKEYSKIALPIKNFFDLNPKISGAKITEKKQGSAEYESIALGFIQELEELEKKADKIATSQNYQVELQDGTKINCERGRTNPLDPLIIANDARYGRHSQCGIFKCDSVIRNGKPYQVTMIFDSNTGSLLPGSVHLSNEDGIGPSVMIRKINSPFTPLPLIENSFFTNSINGPSSYSMNGNDFHGDALPEKMNAQKSEYSYFKDPGVMQYLSFYKQYCSDQDHVLSNLLTAKDKLIAKLADVELVQFIQLLGDNKLRGYFLDVNKAKKLGCMYNGIYLDSSAAKQLNQINKNLFPDKFAQTISMDKARELFNNALKMKDIAFDYKQDGCYARAHLMARRFEAEGVRVDKAWIRGDLIVPDSKPAIEWNFHVAPMVYVEEPKGQIKKIVIDPSLFDRPVTIEEWDKKISKKTIRGSTTTSFPFPENAAFFERSAIAISSSDPYRPDDPFDMSEVKKMKHAEETMRKYKPLETK